MSTFTKAGGGDSRQYGRNIEEHSIWGSTNIKCWNVVLNLTKKRSQAFQVRKHLKNLLILLFTKKQTQEKAGKFAKVMKRDRGEMRSAKYKPRTLSRLTTHLFPFKDKSHLPNILTIIQYLCEGIVCEQTETWLYRLKIKIVLK